MGLIPPSRKARELGQPRPVGPPRQTGGARGVTCPARAALCSPSVRPLASRLFPYRAACLLGPTPHGNEHETPAPRCPAPPPHASSPQSSPAGRRVAPAAATGQSPRAASRRGSPDPPAARRSGPRVMDGTQRRVGPRPLAARPSGEARGRVTARHAAERGPTDRSVARRRGWSRGGGLPTDRWGPVDGAHPMTSGSGRLVGAWACRRKRAPFLFLFFYGFFS
jgi:hypothetical protein